ncbi:lipopolysaccharide biosynthesis protein [Desulfobacula phenolica]|uniref:Membrane protein involved in the export of O-antigen and teichoic acid n=1 Tax=Desulfobacula phenolica TaxID=90732 RepID=A0A1H2EPU4_9BACT|nr:oligosaccharide flippase family protein [Desulfobacula phenolica]SDT96963.1 Membrane protein involved in the export of O-antigen and teichoic acid [Desulfobacula phenolica]
MSYSLTEIIKHTSIYSFGRLASKAIGFLLIPLYTRFLTPEDYGVVEMLTMFIALSGIVIQGGISAAIFKFYNECKSKIEQDELICTILVFIFSLSLLFCVCTSLLSPTISLIFLKTEDFSFYVVLMVVSFFFSTIANVPETYLMAEKKSKIFTLISLATLVINLGFNIYAVAILNLGIEGILYASVAARVFNNILLFSVFLNKVSFKLKFNKLKQVLSFSIPMIPAELGLFVYAYVDRFFLTHMSDLQSVGIYSLGYKFAFMISMLLVQPFMQIWQQKMYEIKKDEDAAIKFGKMFTYLFAFVLFAALFMSIFIKDTIAIMAAPEFISAWRVVPIIAFSYVFKSMYLFFQMGMFFNSKTSYLSYIALLGALISICMNYLLVPHLKELGAAFAILISTISIAAITLFVSQRLYKIKLEFLELFKIIMLGSFLFFFYINISIEFPFISIMVKLSSIPVIFFLIRVFNVCNCKAFSFSKLIDSRY